jgi:hypothetical protein
VFKPQVLGKKKKKTTANNRCQGVFPFPLSHLEDLPEVESRKPLYIDFAGALKANQYSFGEQRECRL